MDQCVSEGVYALPAKLRHTALFQTDRVISALTDADLKLISDKESGFAV